MERGRSDPIQLIAAAVVIIPVPIYLLFSRVYFGNSHGLEDPTGDFVGRDFINLWTASDLWLRGEVGKVFDPYYFHNQQEMLLGHEFALHLWSYPPHFLYFVLPLASMPYIAAYALWSVIGLAVLLAASVTLFRTASLAAIVLALAPAVFINFVAGQSGALVAGLLVGGLRLSTSRPVLAGVLFGLLTVKPQLGLVVPIALLATRSWTAAASSAVVGTIFMLSSGIVFGWDTWIGYMDANLEVTSVFLEKGDGLFQLMMPTAFMATRILGAEYHLAYVVQVIFSVISLIIVYRIWRSPSSNQFKIAVALLAALLATPYAHNYDMTLSAVAVMLLYQAGLHNRRRFAGPLMILVWLLPILVMPLNQSGLPLGPLLLIGLTWSAYRAAVSPASTFVVEGADGGSAPNGALRQ